MKKTSCVFNMHIHIREFSASKSFQKQIASKKNTIDSNKLKNAYLFAFWNLRTSFNSYADSFAKPIMAREKIPQTFTLLSKEKMAVKLFLSDKTEG